MSTLESIILSYLANALWQLPLVFAAGWLAARVLRPFGPLAEHRVWVSVLLLQAFLPAVSSIPSDAFWNFSDFFGGPHQQRSTSRLCRIRSRHRWGQSAIPGMAARLAGHRIHGRYCMVCHPIPLAPVQNAPSKQDLRRRHALS